MLVTRKRRGKKRLKIIDRGKIHDSLQLHRPVNSHQTTKMLAVSAIFEYFASQNSILYALSLLGLIIRSLWLKQSQSHVLSDFVLGPFKDLLRSSIFE
jgi:hypothetical protein